MFKTITSVLDKKKNPSDEDIRKISPYVFCRWLSGSAHTILAANQINLYYNIPIENQYYMIKTAFAGKIKYIPYPSDISEKEQKQVQILADYFKISTEKAKEYIELISKKELNDIINMYTEYELKKGT